MLARSLIHLLAHSFARSLAFVALLISVRDPLSLLFPLFADRPSLRSRIRGQFPATRTKLEREKERPFFAKANRCAGHDPIPGTHSPRFFSYISYKTADIKKKGRIEQEGDGKRKKKKKDRASGGKESSPPARYPPVALDARSVTRRFRREEDQRERAIELPLDEVIVASCRPLNYCQPTLDEALSLTPSIRLFDRLTRFPNTSGDMSFSQSPCLTARYFYLSPFTASADSLFSSLVRVHLFVVRFAKKRSRAPPSSSVATYRKGLHAVFQIFHRPAVGRCSHTAHFIAIKN